MKPASIIFIIVSVVIIIAGLVLCTAGVNTAKEQNIPLFKTDVSVVDGDVVRAEKLDGEIVKVKMTLTDVDVKILPSATGESYMELRNFRIDTFDASVQNKILIIDNSTSIFSIMHIAEGNFKFDGLRHYLTDKKGTNTQKSILLYLANDLEIRNFDLNCKNGNVDIDGFNLNCDYNVTVDTGCIRLSDINTKSNLNLSTDRGYVVLDGVGCKNCAVIVGNGGCDFLFSRIPVEMTADIHHGDIYAAYEAESAAGILLNMNASGVINHCGEEYIGSAVISDRPDGAPQTLTASDGSIYTAVDTHTVTHRFDGYFDGTLSVKEPEKETGNAA